ncbi:hypothetical protein FN846DRAFT_632125 [Sphaerosporella brunnea]|uniref:DUF1445 domain protein n=1 Tax=Sphaerosporella brunnea TaxID=1250544 RepID=A0A5J5EVN6_9PEZI|nr:hypothetical protein FN846DRAFT_17876 [Sphaerosporella brunnea]KAA8909068.1 hypothetical protein FN846DRAFT_632125 [Sphaerosporella brunnea]
MPPPILEPIVVATENSPHAVRLLARQGKHTSPTAGYAPGYIQANLLVVPRAYATDFHSLCLRNPVPCPLLAIGSATSLISPTPTTPPLLTHPFDLRSDIPRYNVYHAGRLTASGITDISELWSSADSHVAFLIGCSFSFEGALMAAGLMPRHVEMGCNVAMYSTSRKLNPAGVFTDGTYVVSMRPYPQDQVERVRDITRPYAAMHGEPIAWGWEAVQELGIADLGAPEFGDAVEIKEGEVPVFWGCGVTPQNAIMRAGDKIKGTVMAHAPGHMLVTDVREEEYFKTQATVL